MDTLLSNMRWLCDEARMLSAISAAYGTAAHSEAVSYGRLRETVRIKDAFVSDPQPLCGQPLYDLASLTKLFTCITALRLCEEGKLSLSQTIGEIDSRFPGLKDITLFDLLSFRAALRTGGRIDEAPDREEGLRRLFASTPCEPARIRIYSDINAMVVKYLIETASGLSFGEAVERFVLRPAGMKDTYARVPESEKHRCLCYNYEHRIAGKHYILRTDILPGIPNDPKASLLSLDGEDLCGHAGLFSSQSDMIRLAQALLSGEILSPDSLKSVGIDRTGVDYGDGTYRQYLGFQCFVRHPLQRLSEVPHWMRPGAFGLSGFTGNHISVDPRGGHFVLFLGNRCHMRVSHITPSEGRSFQDYGTDDRGVGPIPWPDGRAVPSSCQYVYFKDERLHAPIESRMRRLGWLTSDD